MAFFKKSVLQDLLKVPMIIRIQGKELKVTGLVDTGNQLVDPLTGSPVVIVEYGILKRYLPSELQKIIDKSGEVDLSKLTEIIPEDGSRFFFRLIPFTTIGKRHGMLIGFRPDEIIVLTGDECLHKKNVVIGIYNRRLSSRGSRKTGYGAREYSDLHLSIRLHHPDHPDRCHQYIQHHQHQCRPAPPRICHTPIHGADP